MKIKYEFFIAGRTKNKDNIKKYVNYLINIKYHIIVF